VEVCPLRNNFFPSHVCRGDVICIVWVEILEGVHQEIVAFLAEGGDSWGVMNHAPTRQTVKPPQPLMNTFLDRIHRHGH
jgi:hypothetical protein